MLLIENYIDTSESTAFINEIGKTSLFQPNTIIRNTKGLAKNTATFNLVRRKLNT